MIKPQSIIQYSLPMGCLADCQDIIISGGENISSLEVESIMMKHDKIAECAVVARPDPGHRKLGWTWCLCLCFLFLILAVLNKKWFWESYISMVKKNLSPHSAPLKRGQKHQNEYIYINPWKISSRNDGSRWGFPVKPALLLDLLSGRMRSGAKPLWPGSCAAMAWASAMRRAIWGFSVGDSWVVSRCFTKSWSNWMIPSGKHRPWKSPIFNGN